VRSLLRSPSIVHGHGVWRPINLAPLLSGRARPSRVIWSARGALSSWAMDYKRVVKLPFWLLAQKRALLACDCYHAMGIGEYEDFRRLGLKKPVALVPNGIDLPDEGIASTRGKTLLYLGRINPVKGLDELLGAWANVESAFPGWDLAIAGPVSDAYAESVQRRSAQLQRVRVLGEVQGERKRSLLSTAAVLVLPSHSENFGMTVAEALAHGTPVITTTGTPWREIPAKRCGWFVRPEEEALRAALADAMHTPAQELEAMGERGRAWMRDEYSWSMVGERLRACYAWMIEGGRPPSWIHLD
jgi:glycosyltransferase involved in cell wall biosynthesis